MTACRLRDGCLLTSRPPCLCLPSHLAISLRVDRQGRRVEAIGGCPQGIEPRFNPRPLGRLSVGAGLEYQTDGLGAGGRLTVNPYRRSGLDNLACPSFRAATPISAKVALP